MCKIEAMIKEAKEMDAGSSKIIVRKKDGTLVRIICVYFDFDDIAFFLDDLEHLEATYGLGT